MACQRSRFFAVVRLFCLLAFGFLAGLVVLIYDMKFETRRLEDRAAQLQRAIEDEKDNVALMRAEWSHVARPERVETLAREVLKLEPAKPEQLINHRDFIEVLARRPVPTAEGSWQARDDIGALIRHGAGGDGYAPRTARQ
jgi:cell division protein FtsL